MPAILAGGSEGTRPVVRPFFHTHAALAAAHGQLGESAEAERAVRDLLALKPDFARHGEVIGKLKAT